MAIALGGWGGGQCYLARYYSSSELVGLVNVLSELWSCPQHQGIHTTFLRSTSLLSEAVWPQAVPSALDSASGCQLCPGGDWGGVCLSCPQLSSARSQARTGASRDTEMNTLKNCPKPSEAACCHLHLTDGDGGAGDQVAVPEHMRCGGRTGPKAAEPGREAQAERATCRLGGSGGGRYRHRDVRG